MISVDLSLVLCQLSTKIESKNSFIWSSSKSKLVWISFDKTFQTLQNYIKISNKSHWSLRTIATISLIKHHFLLFSSLISKISIRKSCHANKINLIFSIKINKLSRSTIVYDDFMNLFCLFENFVFGLSQRNSQK